MNRPFALLVSTSLLASTAVASAQDWPQWRGASREGHAAAFQCPSSWPEKLAQKWKVSVGRGDASPALAGGKLYVFTRQDKDETLACLEAATGKELWRDK
jgi:outer membrane protein assembly factor BamB